MPASERPTTKRIAHADAKSTPGKTSAAFAVAPTMQLTVKMRLAAKRSAVPVAAKPIVPAMKPSCVAAISQPNVAVPIASRAIRPSAAPAGLNQSDVPSHCAMTTSASAARTRPAAVERDASGEEAIASRSGRARERLREIVDQVVGMLKADRDAQQP